MIADVHRAREKLAAGCNWHRHNIRRSETPLCILKQNRKLLPSDSGKRLRPIAGVDSSRLKVEPVPVGFFVEADEQCLALYDGRSAQVARRSHEMGQ